MNVYYIKRYKAVIVAPDRITAAELVEREFELELGIIFKMTKPTDFIQLDTNQKHVVLLDTRERILDA